MQAPGGPRDGKAVDPGPPDAAAPAPSAAGAAEPAGGPAYRPFLDGLRAIAVLAVLVYHLDRDWLPGGFLGVDVFFVLSGYLITMLLLAEHRRNGRVNLPAFWARRLRRLLPALLVLLVVMAVLLDLGGDPLALGQARGDLLSTLFYLANWHFIASGQSYFTQFLAVSPDRHTWSLAIEEQFYLFWPIVVAVVLTRFRTRTLASVAATAAVASALWMVLIFDSADPSRAYDGTDSRIFEILIGALLAMGLAGRWREQLTRLGRVLAPAGLLILVTALAFLADDNAIYYRGGAVLICVAVAALIAGLEGGSPIARLLSVKPMVMIGLVSYGMYLWHFPIIVFVNEWLAPTSELPVALLATALTFGATIVSYFVIEKPIRRRGMLVRYKLTPARLARVVPVASGIVALAIVVTTINGIDNPAWGAAATPGPVSAVTITTPAPSAATSASPAQTWTDASPSASTFAAPSPTPIGGPGWRVGLVGDSVMVSAQAALAAEAVKRGWTLISAAKAACPVGYEQLYDLDGTTLANCSAVHSLYAGLIAARPDVIVWHDLQSSLARRSVGGALLQPGTAAWKAYLFAQWTLVLNQFLDAGAQVVIVLPPLRSRQTAGCNGVADQPRCLVIQTEDTNIRAATQEFFAGLNGRPGVYLLDVDMLLCPNGYPCPSTIDGMYVRLPGFDQTHFTDQGAAWFAPKLLDLVLAEVQGGAARATTAPPF